MADYIKSTQEQAAAAWINILNQQRIEALIQALKDQDISLEQALSELQKLKDFIGDPAHILGKDTTKHGEIAENVQVYISNARRLIEGLDREYSFDGVSRTAPEDYLKRAQQVQSKFLNGLERTLNGNGGADGILQHLRKYPDFVENGGTYDIPKDQYEEMIRLLDLRKTNPSALSKQDWRVLRAIDFFERESGLDVRKNLNPSIAAYDDVQQGAVCNTVKKEEAAIKKTDQDRRNAAYQKSRPSLREGAKVTAVSAALEGGAAFCSNVAKKRKAGKNLADFTAEDWKDVGIDTGAGTMKGAIRGAAVYTLSNFTATPANVATSLVTAAFGVAAQARLLREGQIGDEEFLINSEALCLDVTVSTVSSMLGQAVIPVPVLGAIIGNVAGMFLYDIAKTQGLKREASLIANYQAEMEALLERLDEQGRALMRLLEENLKKFQSMMDLAFDPDVNLAFSASIHFARFNGVPEDKILKTKADIDAFFLT